MPYLTRLASFVGLLAMASALAAEADPPIVTPVTRASAVFLVRVARADQLEAPNLRGYRIAVHAHLIRMLKPPPGNRALPSEFEARLSQTGGGFSVQPYYWTGKQILPGQEYLILSSAQGGLSEMMESPDSALLIDDKESAVADAELILNSANLSVAQHAGNLATLLADSSTPHSWLLADYAVATTQAGKDYEVSALARALEAVSLNAFSEQGIVHLLDRLRHASMVTGRDVLLRVSVTLIARFFVSGDRQLRPGQEWLAPYSVIQAGIVQTYLPWIHSSERASVLLQTALPRSVLVEFRQKAASLAFRSQVQPRATPIPRSSACIARPQERSVTTDSTLYSRLSVRS